MTSRSDYKTVIMNYAPDYWDKRNVSPEVNDLVPTSEEYRQMMFEARNAIEASSNSNKISKIQRIQNIHDLGQVLIREQLLIVANQGTTYYRVRRYIKIKEQFLQTALKYNLDHRRCGLADLKFRSNIPHYELASNDVLIAVQVVTSNPHQQVITPDNSLEYFIDYVIFLN